MDYRFAFERHENEPTRLRLGGEIDAAVWAELRPVWRPLLESLQLSQLAVDLTDVTFMDSSGVTLLILTDQTVKERSGSVWVEGASSEVQRLLEVTGTVEHFRRP